MPLAPSELEDSKILIVDDDIVFRMGVTRTLSAAGYRCLGADSATAARQVLAEDGEVAAVLCDIRMPDESGLELLGEMSRAPSDLAVIMVTGIDDPATARVAFEIGAYGYLAKPFTKNEILITLSGALKRRELEIVRRRYERALRDEQERLATSNDQLTEANQMLRDFAAVAAHDLRGPIAAVVGFADILAGRWTALPDDEKQELMGIISRQGHRMARMVEDLLLVSRLQAGVHRAVAQRLELRTAIHQALEGCGKAAEAVQVLCPEPLEVSADPDHVQRMVMNYATNALKYGEAPIQIEVLARSCSVEVMVRDRGPGVPRELVPRLFEKFVRGPHRGDDDVGTGLGLSIVRGLARENGGEAWYEPNEPTGACFAFNLPIAPA